MNNDTGASINIGKLDTLCSAQAPSEDLLSIVKVNVNEKKEEKISNKSQTVSKFFIEGEHFLSLL